MTYAFDLADADLTASLRRIAGQELDAALARLDRIDAPEAVHGLRKNLKKTRALLRLVRTGFPAQPSINLALREVGLALSARRDAAVRLATLDRLFPDRPQALRSLRAALDQAGDGPAPALNADLRDTLLQLRDSARDWSLSGRDDRILREGLTATRRKAQGAADAARRSPGTAERFHDWRKRAKDHWYQARLFAPVWPDLFRPLVASADRLGEILGDHHDLAVLEAHVAGLPDTAATDQARRMLDARLSEARGRIEAEAFPLAARLFAGDPEDMARHWIDLRRVWRGLG
jgi:CHAD domain-containing protein